MGKRSRKTTWRNLPIEGSSDQQQCSSVTISDSEESQITINSCHSTSTTCQHRQRYYDSSARGRGSVAHSPRCSRYDPTAAARYHHHSCNGHGDGAGDACARIGHSISARLDRRSEGIMYGSTYRAGGGKVAGDGGGGKITFNEDEYTRITTPRQDVLFKKGYLNRPRPSLAVSSPTSILTTDGSGMDMAMSDSLLLTPDHQLVSPKSPFCYPTAGYIATDELYFFNGFESYPVVVYNTTPPQYCFSTTDLLPSSRSKRYSTDSMTESTTSPQTEEHSGGDGEAPSFLPSLQTAATIQAPNSTLATRKIQTIVNTSQEPIDMNSPLNGNVEQRKLKKKRRRKLSKPINKKLDESTTTSVSVSEDEMTASTDTEEVEGNESKSSTPHVKETPNSTCEPAESPSTCPNSPQSGSSSSSSSSTSSITTSSSPTENADRSVTSSSKASSQLKPDAKEFIPRHYNSASSSVSIDYFNQNLAQYHLIDQLGRPYIQSAFMPLPILLSPVGPTHYMMPPPPPYTTLNHQHHEEGQMDVVVAAAAATVDISKDAQDAQLVAVKPLAQTSRLNFNVHTETTLLKTEFDEGIDVSSSNVPLETPLVQINLSKDDIKVIVSNIEETAREEQENVTKNQRNYCNNKRYNQQQRGLQFAQKRSFNKNAEGSPNRSNNNNNNSRALNNQSSTIQLKTCSKNIVQQLQNVTCPQRKQYSNLFKPTIILNQQEKPVRTKSYLNTSLRTAQNAVSNKQNTLVNHQSPAINKLCSSAASARGQSNSCPTSDVTNPWINVSNRKKRRANLSGGQQNEEQTWLEEMDHADKRNCVVSGRLAMKESIVKADVSVISRNDDDFEQYDVDGLVDVVVERVKKAAIDCEEEVPEDLPPPQMIAIKRELVIVHDIEGEIETVEDDKTLSQIEMAVVREVGLVEKESIEEDVVKIKQNKKSNNKSGKQIKRVMVIDNIQPIIAKESPVKKNVEPNKIEANKATVPKKEVATAETTAKASKTRTKKKSASFSNQTILLSTAEKSASTMSTVQLKGDSLSPSGSYNFITPNSENKTNVEVSQELDMLIQRGMYSILEEKIRSFNITACNDGFFKTINYYGTGKLNVDMTNSAGNKDLNGILRDLKPALKNIKFDLDNINVPRDVLQKQSGNISYGYRDFLGLGPDPHEPDKDKASTFDIITVSPKPNSSSGEFSLVSSMTDDELMTYPITRAVKEWMTKARERTPEIELLKSPTTILRQFTTTPDTPAVVDDLEEEVTLWTLSNQDSVEADQDLLDCWETEDIAAEVKSADSPTIEGSTKGDCFVEVELKMSANSASQGYHKMNQESDEDEVLEVYENRYGKNEDFVRIREEWEERSKSSGNGSCSSRQHGRGDSDHHRTVIPPTASLPYRAICCALM